MVGRVTPNSSAICWTVSAFSVLVGFFVHLPGECNLAGLEYHRYERGLENQLGALGLVLNCVVLWTTVYLDAAVRQLRAQGYPVLEEDMARLSPLRQAAPRCPRNLQLRPARPGPGRYPRAARPRRWRRR
jgi:hypothetical protein